jgi:hypothetical protein
MNTHYDAIEVFKIITASCLFALAGFGYFVSLAA